MKLPSAVCRGSLLVALALSVRVARAEDVPVSDAARQHFKTGVAYIEDPDGARYEEAYREFRAAYTDSPSWKILGNLGISAMKLERDGEAVEAFEKYLTDGGDQIDPAERAQVERDLMTTKAGLVWLTMKADRTGVGLVDERQPLTGRPVTNRYEFGQDGTLKVGVRRGPHKITARAAGFEDAVWEFSAEPGPERAHEFQMQVAQAAVVAPVATGPAGDTGAAPAPGPETKRPIGTPVIIGAAATGALLIGSGVVGFLAIGKNSDFKKANDGLHVDDARSLHDSGKTLNLLADGLLVGGVIAGAVTTILFLGRPEVTASGPATAGHWSVVPVVGANGGGAFARAAF